MKLCYFDDPIEAAAARFRDSEEWRGLRELVPFGPAARVLELGAGRGMLSWAFASEGCEVTALEPDPSDLIGAGAIRELCRRTQAPITIDETAAETLAHHDAAFDIVVCRGVLHHVGDLGQACREAFRVLRPGGRFLAMKEHVADTPAELDAFLKGHPLHPLYGGEHAYPLSAYRRALRDAGFRRIVSYGPMDHPVTYAPAASAAELADATRNTLSARLPKPIAHRLAALEPVRRAHRRWLSWRSREPGRLFSFLAEKPPSPPS